MKLFIRKYGSAGDALVILHGLFGSSDNWITIGKRLAGTYTVFLLDQRNHGKSPHHPVMTYDSMSEDLYEFLTDYSIRQIHLIGHSMGGKTAMQFTIEYPHRVKSLVILDISPKDYAITHDRIIDYLSTIDPAKITTRKEADQKLSQWIEDKSLRQFLLKNLQLHEQSKFVWRINMPVIRKNLKQISSNPLSNKQYTGPVLFIRGEKSNYIISDDFPRIKLYFPNCEIQAVAGASHWLHAENPMWFIRWFIPF